MASVTSIDVSCYQQDDATGSDHLEFSIGGSHVGSVHISTGETKTCYATGHILVGAGDEFVAEEQDLSGDDVIIRFNIDGSEISAGYATRHTGGYSFTVHIGP